MWRFDQAKIIALLQAAKVTPSEDLESEEVEFKEYEHERALHNSKDLAEELSALANKRGGVVVIGVRDSSNVRWGNWGQQLVGAPSIDLLTTKQRITGKLKPQVDLLISEIAFEGKTYVAIEIEHPLDTLVSTASGKTCIREGRSSRPMLPEELTDAVRGLFSYDWSARPVAGSLEELLDSAACEEALRDFSKRRGIEPDRPLESYLEAIDAMRNGVLSAGGLLFLGRREQIRRLLGEFEYRFTWKSKAGSLVVNDVWADNLWNTVHRARSHFAECNTHHSFEFRDTEFTVPLLDSVAFHEAFLNALVHRDYSQDGMVSVTYSEGQLVVTSPGVFYGGVTAENIALHQPRHRNKVLARILMGHHLVDRAGMGVLRMGLRSLSYGRSLPSFRESHGCVEVAMESEFFRAGIAVLTIPEPEKYGIVDLVILNHVYETGSTPVPSLQRFLVPLVEKPWQAIKKSVEDLPYVELCGRRDGIFVRVVSSGRRLFEVTKVLRTTSTSSKHVQLYDFVKQHGEVSNADVRELLGQSHSSQTSKFLRDASYVRRQGSGKSSRWSLAAKDDDDAP